MTPTETGTSAYNAWLEEEYVPNILTEKEKAYLSAVIKPFREMVEYIEKRTYTGKEYIAIVIKEDLNVSFPVFEKMYKGMELNKEYTLEELGL